MNEIEQITAAIKKVTNYEITLCPDFGGVRVTTSGRKFFNIKVDRPVFMSQEYLTLLPKLVRLGLLADYEPNGAKRIALFY